MSNSIPKKQIINGEVSYELECIYCGKDYEECTCWLDEEDNEGLYEEDSDPSCEVTGISTESKDVLSYYLSQFRTRTNRRSFTGLPT